MSSGFFVASEYLERNEPGGDTRSVAAPGAPLPCLHSNNCTEEIPKGWQILGGGHRRMAFVLAEEMILLGKRFGVDRLGFLTLTFADNVQVLKEAQRRFHSLNSHVIRLRYVKAIGVWERQKSRRIHFHLVVVLPSDIRTGFDFAAVDRQDYRSANSALRSEWAFWRKTAKAYGFGRTELLPVKSNAEGIARYVGKYVAKHIKDREEDDKGARVVRFLGYGPGERRVSARFAWNTENAFVWRAKLSAWCKSHGIENLDVLRERVGPQWAWRLKDDILATSLGPEFLYPSREAGERASSMEWPARIAYQEAREILSSPEFYKAYLLQPVKDYRRKKVVAS